MAQAQRGSNRALRGIGSAIFITCLLAMFPLIVQENLGFWTGDVVAASTRWFFITFRFWPAIAVMVGFAFVVAHRIETGDEYKEDLYIYGAVAGIAGLFLAALSFPPVWERVKQFFP